MKFTVSSALPNWRGEDFEILAYVIDKPAADLQPVPVDIAKIPHLQNLQLADTFPHEKCEVDIILGVEDCMKILMDARVKGEDGTPGAQLSHVGWIPFGPYSDQNCASANSVAMATNHVSLVPDIQKFWELEHIGILPNEEKTGLTELETEAVKQHHAKTRKVEGENYYETGLIINPEYADRKLTSNKDRALKRLEGLERRLNHNPELAATYQEQINDLIQNGRAEKVVEQSEPQHQVWYLPHHPVIREDKTTTKCRVVFDGSAKGSDNLSLNDTLLPGPARQPDLLSILLRFRQHQIAVVADVEKMFLNIKIAGPDRDRQRFLWRDLDPSKPPEIYRLTGVTFGLAPSPFSSIQTVIDHVTSLKDEFPDASREILENTFVDDVISGTDLVDDAATLASDMKTVMAEGGFPLKKFISNRPEALKNLSEEDCLDVKTFSGEEHFTTKTLGVKFCPNEDTLMFSFVDKMETNDFETRRTLMSQLHRVYDPMGLLSPFVVRAKQILQRSWLLGTEWDDPLPPDLAEPWLKWKQEVELLDEIKVNRCFIPPNFEKPVVSLHGFGDACEASYGGVIYIRVQDSKTDEVSVSVLCSKTRVVPIKVKRSLPELELMAALVTARLIAYVQSSLRIDIDSIHCWTDSKVTLEWIRKPAYTWQTFVSNRVAEIQRLVPPSQWSHIPGKLNPADVCSRGCSAIALVQHDLW